MKQKLTAGTELDLLTQAELEGTLQALLSGYLRPPQIVRPEGGALLSAGGAGIAEIYIVDPGMLLRITRILVTVSAATFGAPFVGSGGVDIYRGSGNANDSLGGTPFASLPQEATYSDSNGPVFRDGESFRVGVVGGPANGQLYVRAAGILAPLPLDSEAD